MITRCLVLDKRYNKWLILDESLRKNNIKGKAYIAGDGSCKHLQYNYIDSVELPPRLPNTTWYPAWSARPNAYNAWKCHRNIFQEAVDLNEDLFLLEDDAYLTEDFQEILTKTLPLIYNNFDIIYLGWYSDGNLIDTDNYHIKLMRGGLGLHGTIISNKLLKYMLTMEPCAPYDTMLSQMHSNLQAYAIYPCIVMQSGGFSYVENSILEKPDRYKR